MKKLFLKTAVLAFALLPLFSAAQSSGDLKVTVLDESGKPMPGAVVIIVAGGPMTGGATDTNGYFTFRSLTPGNYNVEARMVNYKRYIRQDIAVSAGQTAYSTFNMQPKMPNDSNVVTITAVRSLVDPQYSTVNNLGPEALKHLPVEKGNVAALAMAVCSSCSESSDGRLIMRGARETASASYVDGMLLYGSPNVVGEAVGQVTVLSGGVPAEYGDMTGGAVIITTKSFYTGMAEKQQMYQQAADEKAAAKKAAEEKSGQRTEDKDQIIEKQQAPAAPSTGKSGGH